MLAHGKWQAIRRVSLLLAVFFSVTAGFQYWFIKTQVLNVVTTDLREGVESVRRGLNLREGFDTARFNRADVSAANYFVVLKTGAIVDIESSFPGMVIGVLPTVELPFPAESVFVCPTTVRSEFGEAWRVLGRRLDKGLAVVAISEHDPVHDPDANLITNLNRLGATVQDVVKRSRELDKAIDYAVIDDAGVLAAAAGRIPLRTNPLLNRETA